MFVVVEGGIMYWTHDGEAQVEPEPYTCGYRCTDTASSAIEMTSYALLTYALRNDTSGGLPVMKWLISQQSAFGGYSSTQVGVQFLFFLFVIRQNSRTGLCFRTL